MFKVQSRLMSYLLNSFFWKLFQEWRSLQSMKQAFSSKMHVFLFPEFGFHFEIKICLFSPFFFYKLQRNTEKKNWRIVRGFKAMPLSITMPVINCCSRLGCFFGPSFFWGPSRARSSDFFGGNHCKNNLKSSRSIICWERIKNMVLFPLQELSGGKSLVFSNPSGSIGCSVAILIRWRVVLVMKQFQHGKEVPRIWNIIAWWVQWTIFEKLISQTWQWLIPILARESNIDWCITNFYLVKRGFFLLYHLVKTRYLGASVVQKDHPTTSWSLLGPAEFWEGSKYDETILSLWLSFPESSQGLPMEIFWKMFPCKHRPRTTPLSCFFGRLGSSVQPKKAQTNLPIYMSRKMFINLCCQGGFGHHGSQHGTLALDILRERRLTHLVVGGSICFHSLDKFPFPLSIEIVKL